MQSQLTICPENNAEQREVFSDFEAIQKQLAAAGIGYRAVGCGACPGA
jgi:hypothetical protein